MKRFLFGILVFSFSMALQAQNLQVRDFRIAREIEKSANSLSTTTHSSIRPYRTNSTTEINDSITPFSDFVGYKLSKSKVFLEILPLYELSMGGNALELSKMLHANESLGFIVDFSLNDKLNINYSLTETYQYATTKYSNPNYAYQFEYKWGLLTQNSFEKGIYLKQNFAINYTPIEFFSIELGNGRHFYGDGYRSLLQSDFGKNFPYLKVESEFLCFKYSCVWSKLVGLENIKEDTFRNKYNVTHYLDCRIGKHVNLAFFESVMSNQFLSFEYFNPVIFFRPVEFSMGSDDNALMGANLKVSFSQKNCLYAQLVLDDIIVGQLKNDIKHRLMKSYTGEYGWFANKWGLQFGMKFFDIFKVKNLDCFVEGNIVRPYVYSHGNKSLSYTYYYEPLAHPLGANFMEGIGGIRYYNDYIECGISASYAIVGTDTTNTHFGQNVMQPTMDAYYTYQGNIPVTSYYNVILQGVRTGIFSTCVDIAYFPLKNKALSVFANFKYNNIRNDAAKSQYLEMQIGVRSRLHNFRSKL
ncbi:MAG: hypothetical protein HUK15_00360 [Bacteroidales bacterium]|nr:hypothetical protein [Bacteroidales bacterium]